MLYRPGGAVYYGMGGGNHRMDGSTYPFNIFGHGWEIHAPSLEQLPLKGDTVVGNDVWIGRRAAIMPGVTIGDGAIIGAEAVVVRDAEPYTIVGGNPAREIRRRFSPEVIAELLEFDGGIAASSLLTGISGRS